MSGAEFDEVMDAGSARRLTDQIKIALDGTWQLALRAWEGRAWASLGYESWDAYCVAEFGTSRLRLPRAERDEVVPSLAAAGMSRRAIAAVSGISDRTVRRTLADLSPEAVHEAEHGEESAENRASGNPEAARAEGLDGKTYPPRPVSRADVLLRRARAAALREEGMTQVQIARTLGVAQATVSTDLAELDRISSVTGASIGADDLAGLVDGEGRADVGELGRQLGVTLTPVRDLASMASRPLADVEATLAVVLDRVVMADEWLDEDQRRRAVAVVVPALARSFELAAQILRACSRTDVTAEQWQQLERALAAARVATGRAKGAAA